MSKNGFGIVIWTRKASAVVLPDLSSVLDLNATEKRKRKKRELSKKSMQGWEEFQYLVKN